MNSSSALATDPCVHCGFCLPSCASYRVLGTEMDSPRGRIHSLKAIEAGELTLDATVASHFDSCLGCFACVTACPAGVRYDQLLEQVLHQHVRVCQDRRSQLFLNSQHRPHTAQSQTLLSGMASAPWFFPRGLTPKNQGADATPLRCLITDHARDRSVEPATR